ncbi:DUF4097 family beta strand repeat-containing protein [Longimicrobium sp.]|jgi:hypothetical protein|uniref:DUF4097 family beta strand repeat-containing protein n=1 Tax=Longimicrobium sp. TaxID=2029185 RepID=UPI002F956800
MMGRVRPLAIALALVAGAALPATAQRFVLGTSATVYNLAGEVTVAPGSGNQVVVEVTRGGDDASQLRVNHTGGTLRVVFPGDRVVYPRMGRNSRSQLRVASDGSFGGALRARQVTVAGSGRGTRAWADVRVLVPAGRSVSVHQGVGRVSVTNVDGRVQVHGSSASVATAGTRGSLQLNTGSGSIQVRGAQGDVTADAGSGSVSVDGVRGSRVQLETGSGEVSATNLRAETVAVEVGSGEVNLSGIHARDVSVETGSGSVQLAMASDAQRVSVDTGSGSVTLGLPAGFGADLHVDTGSGGIDVEVPVTNRRTARSRFDGRIGDGDGRVVIDTGSGGVRVHRN